HSSNTLGSFNLDIALLMAKTKVVPMMRGYEDSLVFSVVENSYRLRCSEFFVGRILDRPCVDARWVPEPGPNQIEVVNAVVQNLQTGSGREKCPQMPRGKDSHLHLEIVNLAKIATVM